MNPATDMRDMTKKQFLAALERHGLHCNSFWIAKSGNVGVGLILGRGGKTKYRASLARALNDEDLKKEIC